MHYFLFAQHICLGVCVCVCVSWVWRNLVGIPQCCAELPPPPCPVKSITWVHRHPRVYDYVSITSFSGMDSAAHHIAAKRAAALVLRCSLYGAARILYGRPVA